MIDKNKTKEKILRKLSDEKEKVYCVFQRFREDNEGIDSNYFDDDKGADLIEVFDNKEKAIRFIEKLFLDYNSEHHEHTKKENREFWEKDFNTFIEVREVN